MLFSGKQGASQLFGSLSRQKIGQIFGGAEGGEGRGKIDAGGDAIWDCDRGDARSLGGEEAVVRIFDDERFVGSEAKTAEGFLKKIGRGLDFRGVTATDESFEFLKKGEFFEPAADPIVARRGNDGEAQVVFLSEFDGVADARESVEFFDFGFDLPLALRVDAVPVEFFSGEFFEMGLRRPVLKITADATHIGFKLKDLIRQTIKLSIRFINRPLGIENDAVEVEKQSLEI